MQRLPWKTRLFRHYFMLYPFAVQSADLSEYDLVISSCFGFAKGVRRREGAVHVCYCHNPMRWVWRTNDYLAKEQFSPLKRRLVELALRPLKAWEMLAAQRPDYFIANSQVVADRIRYAFGVDSTVIPPPIDTARFKPSAEIEDYFLVLARLAPYKRLDLAIEACTRLNMKLVVIGDGPDRERLVKMAGPSVTFLGRQPDSVVNHYASHCKALIFPGEEDFGIAPLEINAAGRPVIAFRGGGATETIIEGLNGTFFDRQEVASLGKALQRFETMTWDATAIRQHAEQYDVSVFQEKIMNFLAEILPESHVAAWEEANAA
jgi:glycosyltransferase involved in cell wall biosynthesis